MSYRNKKVMNEAAKDLSELFSATCGGCWRICGAHATVASDASEFLKQTKQELVGVNDVNCRI